MAKKFTTIIKETYQKTDTYKLEKLIEEEKYWQRKLKIANTKIFRIRKKINDFSLEISKKGTV